MPETNKILYINYVSIQKDKRERVASAALKKIKKKKKKKNHKEGSHLILVRMFIIKK